MRVSSEEFLMRFRHVSWCLEMLMTSFGEKENGGSAADSRNAAHEMDTFPIEVENAECAAGGSEGQN